MSRGRLTGSANGAKMLELAIGGALFSIEFRGTKLLLRVNPVAVSQRLQATGHRIPVLGVKAIGVKITERALVRHKCTVSLRGRLIMHLWYC